MKYIGIETFHSHVSYIYREIKHKEWCKNIIYSLCLNCRSFWFF
jgi:hypothetical protein